MNTVCKLCGRDRKLIKSHVIPKSLFKDVFGNNHVANVDLNSKSTKFQSDTGYDKNLFCLECDRDIVGKLDNYFAESIFKSKKESSNSSIIETHLIDNGDIKMSRLSGLNYNTLKLFFISLLLRSSLTENAFFKQVDVSKFHNDLKSMILDNFACSENRFQVSVMKIIPDSTRPYVSVFTPMKSKSGGATHYMFYINTYIIYINISQHNIPDIFKYGNLKEDGTMAMFYLSGSHSQNLFDGLMNGRVTYRGKFKI